MGDTQNTATAKPLRRCRHQKNQTQYRQSITVRTTSGSLTGQPKGFLMTNYITTAELADTLKVRRNTIERWRTNRTLPVKWIRVGRRVLYDRNDVMAYLDSQKRDSVNPYDQGGIQ